MKDVMLDLETLGTRPGCVILSVGACMFDPHTGEVGATFYYNCDRKVQEEVDRLHVDPNTKAWWAKQSKEAQQALLDPKPKKLFEVMRRFREEFWRPNGAERVWCQGATFDVPIYEAAAKATNEHAPWRYYNVRDTRTVYDICGFDPKAVEREGTYHNALDDCRHQVECVSRALAWREAAALV